MTASPGATVPVVPMPLPCSPRSAAIALARCKSFPTMKYQREQEQIKPSRSATKKWRDYCAKPSRPCPCSVQQPTRIRSASRLPAHKKRPRYCIWTANGACRKDPHLPRIFSEDMCQATGTPPVLKYEVDGGPGIERIMGILDGSRERDRDRDRRIFFQAQVLFWMLCAPDGHAKNFSLFLRPGGSYELAPLYDVLSAYPLLGEGPNKLSPFRAKMAMAVRSRNAHWKMLDIQRRHWDSLGERFGVVTHDGRAARHLIDELVDSTPAVVEQVRSMLPAAFPQRLAASVLRGLQDAANKLAGK